MNTQLGDVFYGYIQGNSMGAIGLPHGTRLRIRRTDAAYHGDVAVVRQSNGEIAVKRIYESYSPEGWPTYWLVPASLEPGWKPRACSSWDRVLGVVLDLPETDWVAKVEAYFANCELMMGSEMRGSWQ